jgi:FixJ family two-component response regulator
LIAAVRSGAVAVSTAAIIADAPKEQQREIVARSGLVHQTALRWHFASVALSVGVDRRFSALDTLDSAEHIDCVIVDLVMPKGHPHGLAIAAMGRQKRRDLAVIYMTGHPDIPARIEQEDVLLKPVDPNFLIREIHARLSPTLQHA